ncbi:thermonuclease family protein [Candidatus Bathyarchaeota archaeon]|nr:thermonuclease family protein [Candidatus Bathyarchaeota archaeon]
MNFSIVFSIDVDKSGKVIWVEDGDTFKLESGEWIRLADIDTPEKDEFGYNDSKWYLFNLIYNKIVYLDQSEINGIDNGRLVCVVYLDYSNYYWNINKEMLVNGGANEWNLLNDFNPSTWTLYIPKDTQPPPQPPPQPSTYNKLTIQAPEGSGSTSPSSGVYSESYSYTLTAYPSANWEFSHWIIDNIRNVTSNSTTITMDFPHEIKAVFTDKKYILTIENPEGIGTVNPSPGNYSYTFYQPVKVSANPAPGWIFNYWTCDGLKQSLEKNTTILINADHVMKAFFSPINYTVKIFISGNGSVTKNPEKPYYIYGETIQLSAEPDSGYLFSGWSGSINNNYNSTSLILDNNEIITATFTKIPEVKYNLIIEASEGLGDTDPSTGILSYTKDSSIQVNALPTEGWILDHWRLDGTDVGDSDRILINMTNNRVLKAVFVKKPILTIQITGEGVTNPSSGIKTYVKGYLVSIIAIPSSGWKFDHWELDGNNVGTSNTYQITMEGDHNLEAVFTKNTLEIPGYPFESVIIGLIIGIMFLITNNQSRGFYSSQSEFRSAYRKILEKLSNFLNLY